MTALLIVTVTINKDVEELDPAAFPQAHNMD